MLDISQIDDMLRPERPWVQWAESQLNMSASMARRGVDPETLNVVLSSLQLYATNLRKQLVTMDASYKPVKTALDKILFSAAKAHVQQYGSTGRMSGIGGPVKRPTPQSSITRSPLDSPMDAPVAPSPSTISLTTATLAFDFFPEVTGNATDKRKCIELCIDYMQQSVLPAVRLLHFLLSTISNPQWFRRAVVEAEVAMKKRAKNPGWGSGPSSNGGGGQGGDRFQSPPSRSNSKVSDEEDEESSRQHSPHSDTDTDEGEESSALADSTRNRSNSKSHATTDSRAPSAGTGVAQAAPQEAIKGTELMLSTILPLIQQFFTLWDTTVLRGVMSMLPFMASFHRLRQQPPSDVFIDPLGVSGGRDPPQAKHSIFSPESSELGSPAAMSRSATEVSCSSVQEWVGLQRSFYQQWNECVTSFLAASSLAHEQLEGLVVMDLRLQTGPSSPTMGKSQRGRGAFNDTFSGAGSADGDSSLGDSVVGMKDAHSFDHTVQSAIQECLKESVLRRGLIPTIKLLYTFTKYFCWGKLLRRSVEIEDKAAEGGRFGGLHPFVPQSSSRSDFQLPEIPPVSSCCDSADATYRLDSESLMLADVLRGLAHVLRTTTKAEVEHGAAGLGYVDLCNDIHKFTQRLNDTLQLEVAKSVHTHLKSVARGTVSLLIVPGYLSQSWASHTAYMKGEFVTPAVRTFEAQLQQWWRTLQLYRGPADILSDLPPTFGGSLLQQQQLPGGAPGMATPATMTPDGIPVVPAAAQRFHFHQLLTFALTLFIEECLLWVRCSEARAQQLRIDACFLIRAVRRWRLFYLSKHQTLMPLDEAVLLPNGPDMVGDQMYHACSLNQQPFGDDNSEQCPLCIDCLLLRLAATVSLRTCETEVVLKLIQHREGILLDYGQSSNNGTAAAKLGGAGTSLPGGAAKPVGSEPTTGNSSEEERPPQFLYDIWNAPAHTQLTLAEHFQPRLAGKDVSIGQSSGSGPSGSRQLNIWTFRHGSQDFVTPAFPPFVPPMALVAAREAASAKSRQPFSMDRRGASPQKQREGAPSSGGGPPPNSRGAPAGSLGLPGAEDPALVAPLFLPPAKLKQISLPFHYVTLAPYFTPAALSRRENPGTFATCMRVGCITTEDEKSVIHQLILSRWQQWDTYPKLTPEEEEHVKWIRSKTL